MPIIIAIFVLFIDFLLLLWAAWLGHEYVPVIIRGHADLGTYFWLAFALMLIVFAGAPSKTNRD